MAAAVRYFGPALGLRRSLFLADANALAAPMRRLREWFAVIREEPLLVETGLAARGVYSFVDAFSAQRRSVADWAELAALGLRRVYIGMESGDNRLLAFLRKPGTVEEIRLAVESLKGAGLGVSVIVILGIGGDRYAGTHVELTAAALNAMPLGPGDIIYFSPFEDAPGSDYSRLAGEAGIRPLSGPALSVQEAAIRERLRPRDAEHRPQCSRYQIREFVY